MTSSGPPDWGQASRGTLSEYGWDRQSNSLCAPLQVGPGIRDLLTELSCQVRALALLGSSLPILDRTKNVWAIANTATTLGSADVVAAYAEAHAEEAGVTATLRSSREGIRHVVNWAMRGMMPFATKPDPKARAARIEAAKARVEKALAEVEDAARTHDAWLRDWRCRQGQSHAVNR